MAEFPALELVCERKIRDLLPHSKPTERWEASGVLVRDGHCFVVFDDRVKIARLADDLRPNDSNRLVGMSHVECGYEGIAYNATKERYYLLVEARKHGNGCYKSSIVEYDGKFKYLKDRPLDFPFESNNKGFEAVAHVERDGQDYLLALCEGNKCKCGKKGRVPGGGRVQVFEKKKNSWRHFDTVALPTSVQFIDYSGMSIDRGRVAVVSQVSSMLWIGQFEDWTWRDAGQLYEFPRFEDGSIQYGNIEGVAWITPTRTVTVSDRRKKSCQPEKVLTEKDQSVHIFDIPT